LEAAAENVEDEKNFGISRLVILAPVNAEVYVNDERKGSIGSSGKLILTTVPTGRHVLRVSKVGEKDDERVIEIQAGAHEQVIQAQLKPLRGASSSQPSPSGTGGASSSSGAAQSSVMPGIVACTNCQARFAQGVKYCGKCGNRSFNVISEAEDKQSFPCPRCLTALPPLSKFCGRCGLNMMQTSNPPKSQPIGFQPKFSVNVPNQVEKICQRCGGKFPPSINFCGRCGNNL
ncbi:MAG: zinc ribbon domain-containing protein, partial [Pyrinomonadaceae bacterium]|nr:zinc ribbon domain-containing protein [Pyrinomonadaceae bacterium]